MKYLLIPVVLITSAVLTAHAAQATKTVTIGGVSASTCGKWSALRHDHASTGHEQWILGYLSGAADNASDRVNPLERLDYFAITSWMDNYCKAHPLDDMLKAARSFEKEHPR